MARFERLSAAGNGPGLFKEEEDMPVKPMTGDVLQAPTHLAIVNTAPSLSRPVLVRGA